MVAAREYQTAIEERISRGFAAFCESNQLTVLSLAADKHGSSVWEAGATVEGLDRYVELALTPTASSPEVAAERQHEDPSSSYLISLTLIVDDQESYARQPFEQWRSDVASLAEDDALPSQIERSLALCWQRALQLTEQNLTEQYPFPHRSLAKSR